MKYNHGVRCLTCKYELSHLTEHRCPECGRGFDPNNRYTFGPKRRIHLTTRELIMLSLFEIAVLYLTWLLVF